MVAVVTDSQGPGSLFPSWGNRVEKAVDAWQRWEMLPLWPRMDRAFKESGVRDLVVEIDQLRKALIDCAEAAGEDGEAVEAARSGAMTHPDVTVFALEAVQQLARDYFEDAS